MNLEEYKNWLNLQYDSPKTAEDYYIIVNKFLRQYNELTQVNLNNYFIERLKTVKDNTFNKDIYALKSLDKFIKSNLEFPKDKKPDKRIKEFITEKELFDICKYLVYTFKDYEKIELIFQLMFYTGLRREEICNLTKESFLWDKKKLLIINTKGKVDRMIPFINENLCDKLKSYINEKGLNISIQELNYYFSTTKEKLNLKINFTPKTMRISCAKYLWSKGIRREIIQKFLGHASADTTDIYLDLSEDDMTKELEKIKI